MLAAYIEHYGKDQSLTIGDLPAPEPADTDLLVSIRAASVNPIDFKVRNGDLRAIRRYRFPLILGHDFSGVVVGTGRKVTRFRAGDEVFGRAMAHGIGTFAQQIAVDEAEVARKPASVDFAQAASLPLVGLTSWQALVELGRIGPGQKVFIHAGSGGIGSFALQLAKHLGAFVTATTSGRNVEMVRALGADVVIDYTKEDFTALARDQDLVFATLGGDALYRSFEIVAPGGIVISLSEAPDLESARQLGLGWLKTQIFRLMSRRANAAARRHGARYRYLFMRADGTQLARIAECVDQGSIRPVVDRVFPLEQAQAALSYSETGRARGKIVVAVSP